MTPTSHPQPYTGGERPNYGVQAPPPPRTGPRVGRIIGFTLAGVVALCVAGGVVVAAVADQPTTPAAVADQDDANRAAAATTAPTSAAATTAPPATGKAQPPAVATTAPKPTKTTPPPVIISDGTYRVGEDIPAGRYKVTERAEAGCYWSRTKNGDIIDNSLAGGFPSFTVRKGEDVEIMGCPDFKRIGK